MSENSSNSVTRVRDKHWGRIVALPLWVLVGFGVSKLVFTGVTLVLLAFGVHRDVLASAFFNTIFAAAIYALSLVIVIFIPWWLKKHRTSKEELGLQRLPSWMDIGLAPLAFVLYLLLSGILLYVITLLFPAFDSKQVQETGFANLASQYEYILAFLTLVVVVPVAEEILFRGYLYGKLRKTIPAWLTILVTSVLFAVVHGQWNVAVDVLALSGVLCVLREVTGSIWAGILLHMLKNGVAFYLLFVNPSLLGIM